MLEIKVMQLPRLIHFFIEIIDPKVVTAQDITRIERPLKGETYNCVTFQNTIAFNDYKGLGSSAPFGIFPLSDIDCFDLMSQQLHIRVTSHLEGIMAAFDSLDIELGFFNANPEDRQAFTKAVFNNPTGSKEQSELVNRGLLKYVLRDKDGQLTAHKDQGYFGLVVVDLFSIETLVMFEKFRRETFKKMVSEGSAKLENSTLHVMMNERSIWR